MEEKKDMDSRPQLAPSYLPESLPTSGGPWSLMEEEIRLKKRLEHELAQTLHAAAADSLRGKFMAMAETMKSGGASGSATVTCTRVSSHASTAFGTIEPEWRVVTRPGKDAPYGWREYLERRGIPSSSPSSNRAPGPDLKVLAEVTDLAHSIHERMDQMEDRFRSIGEILSRLEKKLDGLS